MERQAAGWFTSTSAWPRPVTPPKSVKRIPTYPWILLGVGLDRLVGSTALIPTRARGDDTPTIGARLTRFGMFAQLCCEKVLVTPLMLSPPRCGCHF